MKRLIVSSSLVLAFSLYILASPPDVSETAVFPAATVGSTSPPAASAIASKKTAVAAVLPSKSTATAPPPKPIAQSGTNAAAPTPSRTPAKSTPSAPTPTPAPAPAKAPASQPKPAGQYKDGTYTGGVADAYYGNVQVQVAVSGGKIANVNFLDYPQDRGTSREINSQAMPILISEAIQVQNANVNIVSGATATSEAFRQSLASALTSARA